MIQHHVINNYSIRHDLFHIYRNDQNKNLALYNIEVDAMNDQDSQHIDQLCFLLFNQLIFHLEKSNLNIHTKKLFYLHNISKYLQASRGKYSTKVSLIVPG